MFGWFNCSDKKDSFMDTIMMYEMDKDTNVIFLVNEWWHELPKEFKVNNSELRYHIIDMDDYHLFLERINMISKTDGPKTIDIIFHTSGGSIESSDTISNVLINYPHEVRCHVPNIAQSAGTLLALSGDKLFMNSYSVLGPVDPQLTYQVQDADFEETSSKCLIKLKNTKTIDKISDNILIKIIESDFLHEDGERTMKSILNKKREYMGESKIDRFCKYFCSGDFPHHKPINREEIESLGIIIDDEVSSDINDLYVSYLDFRNETLQNI